MRALALLLTTCPLLLAACVNDDVPMPASTPEAKQIAARLATAPTFRKSANDAAAWIDPTDASRSFLLVSGGEGGIEMTSLAGERIARFETVRADFVDIRQNVATAAGRMDVVITSEERLGAMQVYRLDAANQRVESIGEPIAVDDAITGLCTYVSPLTEKLYAFAATDQGQLEQWEVFVDRGKAQGRFVRRIAAGRGTSHCVVDDASGRLFFSEESVGLWQVAAEPEADATRRPVDLIEPRGSLNDEVKGVAVYRAPDRTPYVIAANVGNGSFNVYSLSGERVGTFRIGGNDIEVEDVEGVTAVAASLGSAFPDGALVIADEDAGNYKLVSWSDVAQSLALPAATGAAPETSLAARIVKPSAETEPVVSYGDAADDPAIWVDRSNPARSVIIGTDKKLGLNVYDLSGKRLQTVPDGRMNNVDLRDGFMLGGVPTTIVAATNRTTKSISLYRLDHTTRRLSAVGDGTLASGLEDPYGLCMYHSAKSGDFFVLANDSVDGKLRQWKLVERNGKVGMEVVRDIRVGSQAEGCAADDELGNLFVAEEDVGLWKYSAEPDGGDARTAVDKVGDGRLTADAEGVAIYYGPNGTGFIVLSNQGEDNYAVYRREGANEFVGKFHVVANEALGIDGASETDGLDVVSAPLGAAYPMGLLVVQDGRNLMPAERQNFKLVSWKDVMEALQ